MRWRKQAVESVRPSRFRPPFCPWPDCEAHRKLRPRFHRHGYYRRPSDRRRIPRYLCLHCRRTCSKQTFAFSYYLKRRDLPVEVAQGLVACAAHRQIARSRRCAKTTVTRLAQRLGRHAILVQVRALAAMRPLREAVVHDHFETFVGRQDQALGIGTAVGSCSQFIFDIDPAPHRGSGRRPDRKGQPKAGHATRDTYCVSIARTLDRLARIAPSAPRIKFVCDGRQDYRAALNRQAQRERFELEIHPNPERGPKHAPRNPQARRRDRAMFPVDSLHQLLRHSQADHKRETIAFGRSLESIVGRVFLFAVWKNWIKGRSERKPDRTTPAMALGLSKKPWSWSCVLVERLFVEREAPPETWRRVHDHDGSAQAATP